MNNIYLDNAASTRIDDDVLEYMSSLLKEIYANPSSIHQYGQKANNILEESREKVASLLGCKTKEVIFTSSATEANNMIFSDVYKNIGVSSIEHSSIYNQKDLKNLNFLNFNPNSIVNLNNLNEYDLLSIISVNSETGIEAPIDKIRGNYNGILHSDCVQSLYKIKETIPFVDSCTISSHKIHGPKGVGILIAKDKMNLNKIIYGSNRERNKRGGTENVPAIAAAAMALEKAISYDYSKLRDIRNYFESKVKKYALSINGKDSVRAPHISNISFDMPNDIMLFKLDLEGIYASAGSACNSGSIDESKALKAMHLSEKLVKGSIRFSFSKYTTYQEIDKTVEIIKGILRC